MSTVRSSVPYEAFRDMDKEDAFLLEMSLEEAVALLSALEPFGQLHWEGGFSEAPGMTNRLFKLHVLYHALYERVFGVS